MLMPRLPLCQAAHPYEAIGKPEVRAGTGGRRRGSFRAAAVLCVALLCSGGLWAAVWSDIPTDHGLGSTATEPPRLQGLPTKEALDLMQVVVTSDYQRDGLYPWEHMAEPMRETRLEIRSWPAKDGFASGLQGYM